MQEVFFKDLGDIAYKKAWDYQEELLQQNVMAKSTAAAKNKIPAGTEPGDIDAILTQHYLLLCEHPAVYTLGKSGKESNILISEEERMQKGIEYYPTNRGGDITFHGPLPGSGIPGT